MADRNRCEKCLNGEMHSLCQAEQSQFTDDPNRSPFYGMPLCPHRIQFGCDQCRSANGPVLEGDDIFDWAAKADELTAQILEYEHAMEHVIDCGSCEQCMRLVQSALDGRNRADFRKWSDDGQKRTPNHSVEDLP